MLTISQRVLDRLEARRENLITEAEAWTRSLGEGKLTPPQEVRYRQYVADLRELAENINDTRSELERQGSYSLKDASGHANSAGRLAPLAFPDDELRRLQGAAQRGDNCRVDARAFSTAESLLPAQLFPSVVGQQHEGRLLDHLPGVAMETGSIDFIRHISTTGAPATVAEGALKPELVMVTDALTEAARKIAAHVGVSYEIAADFLAFQQYAIGELQAQIIDAENAQLLTATGTGTNMTGFYATSGILTHDASADTDDLETALDSIEIAITALRTGSALATADVLVLNPADWSKLRRIKDTQGRFLTQPDPTTDEANSLWGIDVIQTTQNPVGKGLLLDSTKCGYVGVREPIAIRTGWATDDFTRNVQRFVAEERLVLCCTRPAAVLAISGL
jgi:HK97 family phage major capsid protein